MSQREEDGSTCFKVELHCTKTGWTERTTFTFPAQEDCKKVGHIKAQVEKEHNIPVCVQTLSYESNILTDKTSLDLIRARSGDTFHIAYPSKGDCKEILKIINWLTTVSNGLKTSNPSVTNSMDAGLETVIANGLETQILNKLGLNYFYPWKDQRTYVNKLHFDHNGGIELICEIHRCLLRQPWEECLPQLKAMEFEIIAVLWNMMETFAISRRVIQCNGLEMCIRSLLRQELKDGDISIDTRWPPSRPRLRQDNQLVEVMDCALGAISNLSELPEVHLILASNADVLKQLSRISITLWMNVDSKQRVAMTLLCLAKTTETHKNLAHPVLISRVLNACMQRIIHGQERDADTVMLNYYTLVFLAHITLMSPQLIPNKFHDRITSRMRMFLKTVDDKMVTKCELERDVSWSMLLPYIKLMYTPERPQANELTLLSQELIIFSLMNMLGREKLNHRKVLVEEGLVDYVTCMPLYVPPSLKGKASELVQMLALSEEVAVNPPTLVSLAKAKLAKMHFGLEPLLKRSLGEIIAQVLPTQ